MPLLSNRLNPRVIKEPRLDVCKPVQVKPEPLAPPEVKQGPSQEEETFLTQARQEAARLLAEVRREGEDILAAARGEAEKIKEQAYAEGFQKGYREAVAKAQAEAGEIRSQAKELLAQARRLKAEIIQESEEELVSLALALAEKIIQHQIEVNPETIRALAREVCRRVYQSEKIYFFVHPDDVPTLQAHKEELKREFGQAVEMRVIGDMAVARGGCRVETEKGEIDATVEGQFAALRAALAPLFPTPNKNKESEST